MNKKQHEKEILENEIVTWTEKKFGHLKPHLPMIGICSGLFVVICIVFVYYQELSKKNQAMPWNMFNVAVSQTRMTGDTRALTQVADEYPENTAGLWALQLAADFELRTAISQFGEEETVRKQAFEKVDKARNMYQRIVDSTVEKTPMLNRRSLYGLAYANETVGEFKTAKNHYQTLADSGGDSPFLAAAKRGVTRTSDPEYVAMFDKFRNWQDTPGDAPGPVLPTRPDIGFPEANTTPAEGGGGGAFEPPANPPTTPDDGAAAPLQKPEETPAASENKKSEAPAKNGEPPADASSSDKNDK